MRCCSLPRLLSSRAAPPSQGELQQKRVGGAVWGHVCWFATYVSGMASRPRAFLWPLLRARYMSLLGSRRGGQSSAVLVKLRAVYIIFCLHENSCHGHTYCCCVELRKIYRRAVWDDPAVVGCINVDGILIQNLQDIFCSTGGRRLQTGCTPVGQTTRANGEVSWVWIGADDGQGVQRAHEGRLRIFAPLHTRNY